MAISGIQTINVGLPNESAGSDSLYSAFTKVNQNFSNIKNTASPYNTFNSGDGIGVTSDGNTGTVTITNTGVTQLVAGTDITLSSSNGIVTISANGGSNGGGGTVTSISVLPVSGSRLTTVGSPIVSSGNIYVDLVATGVVPGTYTDATVTVDSYGRVTSIATGVDSGVTSVALAAGNGISVAGSPITTSGTIIVTNTGVTRLTAGSGISLTGSNGDVTVSVTNLAGGTVTSVELASNALVISGSPVTTSGTIYVDLPNNISIPGNLTANRIIASGGNINGNLNITGNISPASNTKIGGVKAGPGANISLDGLLTIDTTGLPLSFGNFTANNNILTVVNTDENMILQTSGNAEIQLIGNIGFYIPDGIPPNVANRYFYASSDGTVHSKYLDIQSYGETNFAAPLNVTIDITGNYRSPNILTGTIAQFTGKGDLRSYVIQDNYGNDLTYGTGGQYVFRTARGNVDNPANTLANDNLGSITAAGWSSDNGYGGQGSGYYNIVANENITSTARGGRLEMWVVPNGTTTPAKIATIDGNGLNVTGVANITGNVSAGNVSGTNGAFTTVAGSLTTNSQPNITSVGTLGNLSVTGNVNAGNLVLSTGNIIYTPRHGSFYSNVDQTNPVANTARAMTFNNTVTANGASIVSNSQITINKIGVYNIQFSAQVSKTGGGTGVIDIWLSKNGAPVDWTNTSIPVTSGTPAVAAWNFVENVTVANTYFELMWSSADTLVSLDAVAANTNPTRPGIPSVIVTVTPVGA